MVAAEQHRRDVEIAESLGARVLRVLEKAGRERVAFMRRLLDRAGQEPHDRVDQDEGRQLAAGEDVVADAHLAVDHGPHAVVDPLVAAADRAQCAPTAARSRASASVRRSPAGSSRTTSAPAARSGSMAAKSGSGRMTIPAPPPYGLVVDRSVTAEAVLAEVVDAVLDDPVLGRAADDRRPQRDVEELGEDRDDVDPHRSADLLGIVGRRRP